MHFSMKRLAVGVTVATMLLQVGTMTVGPAKAIAAVKDSKQDAAGAYYQVLDNLIKNVGICTEDITNECAGVAYGNLIDFDKNGIPELYIIYKKKFETDYYQEIWNYKNGKANKIFEESYYGATFVSDRAVSITQGKTNLYLNYTSQYSTGVVDKPLNMVAFTTDIFHTIVNNKLVEIAAVQEIWEEYQNGKQTTRYVQLDKNHKEKKISKAVYTQIRAKYGYAKRQELITSDLGSQGFAFDYKNNLTIVVNLLTTLKNSSRSGIFKNSFSQMKAADKTKLISFLYHFDTGRSLDVKKMTDRDIAQYIHDGLSGDDIIITTKELTPVPSVEIPAAYMADAEKAQASGEEEDASYTYNVYSAKQINALTQGLFGRTIKPMDYIIPGDYPRKLLRYNNGYYYHREYGRNVAAGPTSPQVNTLYSLGSGLYYAEFNLFYFPYGENIKAQRKYLTPLAAWTAKDKAAVYDNLKKGIYGTGYALLKEVSVNGVKSWQLVKYISDGSRLSDKQLTLLKK